MPEQQHESADRGDLPDLGLRAYATDEHSNADLLKNLEGRRVHRLSEGTAEHAGTALMAVELSDDEMLGVQVSMAVDTSSIEVYPDVRERDEGSWVCDSFTERWSLDRIEEPCPDCEIVAVLERNIMDPETAEVLAVLDAGDQEPFAITIHHDEYGRTEFFEL